MTIPETLDAGPIALHRQTPHSRSRGSRTMFGSMRAGAVSGNTLLL